MRRRVDAARHARGDDDAGLAEPGGQLAGEPPAIGRGVARADHRDDRRDRQQFGAAEHGQHRRRILDRGEQRRIERLAPAQQPSAEPLDRGEFRLGLARVRPA